MPSNVCIEHQRTIVWVLKYLISFAKNIHYTMITVQVYSARGVTVILHKYVLSYGVVKSSIKLVCVYVVDLVHFDNKI
jgi:hypothetical protein